MQNAALDNALAPATLASLKQALDEKSRAIDAFGAARAAAMVSGGFATSADRTRGGRVFEPGIDSDRREKAYAGWKRAVARALDAGSG